MPTVRRTYKGLLTADEYYKSIQPLFFFTQLLGLASYVVGTNRHGEKTLKTSRLAHFMALLLLASFAYCCTSIVYYKTTYIGYFLNTDVTNGGEKCIVLASGATAVVVLISNIVRRRHLLWVLQYFVRIDKHFTRIGICWNYTKVLRHVICILSISGCVILVVVIVSLACWSRLEAYPPWPLLFLSLNQTIGITLTILLFSFLMLSTRLKIQALNKILTSVMEFINWNIVGTGV